MISNKQIEVKHDGANLPFKKKVRPLSFNKLTHRIQEITQVLRPRGLRVRYSMEPKKGYLLLEARNKLAIDRLLRALYEMGYVKEVL